MNKYYLQIAWTVTLVATLGSLLLSNVLHWEPCILCWYQRIFLFPLVIVLAVAIIKNIKDVDLIVLPMTIIGGLVAVYHNLLQYGIIPETLAPCSTGASCITNYFLFVKFITVPFTSLVVFIAITILMLLYRRTKI